MGRHTRNPVTKILQNTIYFGVYLIQMELHESNVSYPVAAPAAVVVKLAADSCETSLGRKVRLGDWRVKSSNLIDIATNHITSFGR